MRTRSQRLTSAASVAGLQADERAVTGALEPADA